MSSQYSSKNYLDIIKKPFYKIDTSLNEKKFKSIIEEIKKNRHHKKYHILVFKDNSIGKKYIIDDNEKFFGVEKTLCSHDKNDHGMIYFSMKSLKFKNLFTEENLKRKENLLSFYIISHKKYEIEKLVIENFNLYEHFKKDIDYAIETIEKAAKDEIFDREEEFLNIKKSLIMKNNEISFETICKLFLNQRKIFSEGFDHKKNTFKILINNKKRSAYLYVFFIDNQFRIGQLWEAEESSDPSLPVIDKERTFSFYGFNGEYNLKQIIFDKHTVSQENYDFIYECLKEHDNINDDDAELLLINLNFDLHSIDKHININVDGKELLENLIYFN